MRRWVEATARYIISFKFNEAMLKERKYESHGSSTDFKDPTVGVSPVVFTLVNKRLLSVFRSDT